MRKITVALIATCLVLAAGCRWIGIRGNGNIKTDERTVRAFANIDASGAFQIEWQNGPHSLRITTDENLLPFINSYVSRDTLSLHTREEIWPTRGIKVVISSPMRTGARIRGAVKLAANQMAGRKFALEATGASRVTLQGSVDELLVDMTGASELTASGLQTETAEISTAGAAEAEVAVADTLKVAISGASKVTYSGNPKTIEKRISGTGSIRQKK